MTPEIVAVLVNVLIVLDAPFNVQAPLNVSAPALAPSPNETSDACETALVIVRAVPEPVPIRTLKPAGSPVPFKVRAPVPRTLAAFTRMTPCLWVTPPVKVFAPDRIRAVALFVPVLVKEPDPDSTPP